MKLYSVSVVNKLEPEDDGEITKNILMNTKYDEFAKVLKDNIWIDYLDKDVMELQIVNLAKIIGQDELIR